MHPMTHVSITELRTNLATRMTEVCQSRDVLIVTRQNEPSVVMLAQDEFESIMETVHLLRSPANAARLLRSVAAADAGELTEFDPTA
jgi:antitoxin YefM